MLISVSLAFEAVADDNPLLQVTAQVHHPGYNSLPSIRFPRPRLTDQPEKKGQVGGLHMDCPSYDSKRVCLCRGDITNTALTKEAENNYLTRFSGVLGGVRTLNIIIQSIHIFFTFQV